MADVRSSIDGGTPTRSARSTPSVWKAARIPRSSGGNQAVKASGVITPGSASAALVVVHAVAGPLVWWIGFSAIVGTPPLGEGLQALEHFGAVEGRSTAVVGRQGRVLVGVLLEEPA
jgi:hypothetical protein